MFMIPQSHISVSSCQISCTWTLNLYWLCRLVLQHILSDSESLSYAESESLPYVHDIHVYRRRLRRWSALPIYSWRGHIDLSPFNFPGPWFWYLHLHWGLMSFALVAMSMSLSLNHNCTLYSLFGYFAVACVSLYIMVDSLFAELIRSLKTWNTLFLIWRTK